MCRLPVGANAGDPVTERLYYHDATLRSFSARVVEIAGDGTTVYLDRTAFYPTSGGQPHDTGTLGGCAVTDVVDEGTRIAHVLEAPLRIAAGAEVPGEIDWSRRHDHMQQHTGQHLLSAVLADQLGFDTVSVHFGPESSTLDVADRSGGTSILDADALAEVERSANRLIADARRVVVTFEDAASVTGLRKPVDRGGELRVVTIEGVDRSACGGTHVSSTAQIGFLQLRRQERVRHGVRIEFVCGERAVRRARRDLEALARVARVFSASLDDAARLVEAQAAEVSDLRAEHRRLVESQAKSVAVDLYTKTEARADGLRIITQRVTAGVDSVRALALACASLEHVVYVGASHEPPSVLVASSNDSGVHAGNVLKNLLPEFGGRGGGSARLAQGSLPSASAVDEIVERLVIVNRES